MATTPSTRTTPTLKRVPPRHYRPRPIFWYDPEDGDMLLQSEPERRWMHVTGDATDSETDNTLRDVLIAIAQLCQRKGYRNAVLYLAGASGAGYDAASTMPPDWYRAPLADSWRITSWRTGPMAVTYETFGKLTVSVRVAASWFDEGAADASRDTLAHAYRELQDTLNQQFSRQHAYLLGTPAQTGLDLLEQSLPYGLELPILPDDLRERIQHNSPQGRNEVFTAPGAQNAHLDTLPWLQCYDAKWMYAACVNHVPAGPYVIHPDPHPQDFDPWAVGIYRVFAVVPDGWCHIGPLPAWEPEEKKTLYPWQPETVFESWCTGAELQVAIENGWACHIQEAIIWPDAQKLNPLRNWRDNLVAARAHAEKREKSTDLDTALKARLIATAIRHILIDTIGALARRVTPEHHLVPSDQKATIPPDAYNLRLEEWGIEYDVDRPLSGWAARFQHPEISAMVWGRARARLAKKALELAMESIILARTDALWLALYPDVDYRHETQADLFARAAFTETEKNGKPGEWRVKEYLPGADIPAPRDTGEALALMRRARGKGA